MALIQCADCGKEVSDKSAACIGCGAPLAAPAMSQTVAAPPPGPYLIKTAKNRGIYIILGLFLGCFGIHNFYAGFNGRGIAQLLITLIFGWFIIGIVITAIWTIIELITQDRDAAGDRMV